MGKSRFLGEFEQFVLLAILRLGEQAYGTTIRQILLDVIQREDTLGALEDLKADLARGLAAVQ